MLVIALVLMRNPHRCTIAAAQAADETIQEPVQTAAGLVPKLQGKGSNPLSAGDRNPYLWA